MRLSACVFQAVLHWLQCHTVRLQCLRSVLRGGVVAKAGLAWPTVRDGLNGKARLSGVSRENAFSTACAHYYTQRLGGIS